MEFIENRSEFSTILKFLNIAIYANVTIHLLCFASFFIKKNTKLIV